MIIPTLSYAITPWIFLHALKFESMVVMNLMWDLLSDVLVTLSGFFYFQEKVGPYKTIGVVLSLIALTLMSIEDGKWEDFLGH
jgi:drug/metabolite transporter (DMT)-like permease